MSQKTLAVSAIADWIEARFPVSSLNAKVGDLENLDDVFNWDEARNIYILDDNGVLKGLVPISKLVTEHPSQTISKLIEAVPLYVYEHESPQSIVYKAIRKNVSEVPVIHHNGKFVGVVSSIKLLSIMHDRHLEEALLMSGIRREKGQKSPLPNNAWIILKTRLPWLLAGLTISLLLGFIVSRFQSVLDSSIALAFFMPVITYMAASVGMQSEAVTIHALSVSILKNKAHVTKEVLIGMGVGLIVGVLGGLGAFVISQPLHIGIVVMGSLFAAVIAASFIGTATPLVLKALHKDPSVASGPVAAAIQDAVSLLVYFSLATLLLIG